MANAATGIATTKETPTPQPIPGGTVNHHDQKKFATWARTGT
ncbi:hypothetical protein [Mycolicibacter terrae]|nr:hypothetical protein [Mycolicibacter terrae]